MRKIWMTIVSGAVGCMLVAPSTACGTADPTSSKGASETTVDPSTLQIEGNATPMCQCGCTPSGTGFYQPPAGASLYFDSNCTDSAWMLPYPSGGNCSQYNKGTCDFGSYWSKDTCYTPGNGEATTGTLVNCALHAVSDGGAPDSGKPEGGGRD